MGTVKQKAFKALALRADTHPDRDRDTITNTDAPSPSAPT